MAGFRGQFIAGGELPPRFPPVAHVLTLASLRLLETGLFADVTVKCQDTIWSLHKNILCTRSVWFEKALCGNFEEARTNVVTIGTFSSDSVHWVIRYIYTGGKSRPSHFSF